MTLTEAITEYICPTMGCVMASVMFAAPVKDLRQALGAQRLGSLNPFPWVMMTGNCLGWVVYGYYTRDPFVVAANIPGLVLSIWLNLGASKLQYHERLLQSSASTRSMVSSTDHPMLPEPDGLEVLDGIAGSQSETPSLLDTASSGQSPRDNNNSLEDLILVPQERALMRLLVGWCCVLIWVGWFPLASYHPATIVGWVVNANLVFFYGAPLQTMQQVFATGSSESIHVPTMVMNWLNTSFWITYGIAVRDPIIILPNCLGLALGLVQGVLCAMYPRKGSSSVDVSPQQRQEESIDGDAELPPRADENVHVTRRRVV